MDCRGFVRLLVFDFILRIWFVHSFDLFFQTKAFLLKKSKKQVTITSCLWYLLIITNHCLIFACFSWSYQVFFPTSSWVCDIFSFHISSFLNLTFLSHTVITVDIIPRRIFMVCTYFVTGILTILCTLYPDIYVIVFVSVLSYYMQQAPWALLYCYTTEVFSTKYRSTGLGMCTSSARIGGICAPMISQFLFQIHPAVPNVLIGFACALASVFIFFLPYETHQRYLTDDEGESDKKIDRKFSVHRIYFLFFPESINNQLDEWVNGKSEYSVAKASSKNLLLDEDEDNEHRSNVENLSEKLINWRANGILLIIL